MRSPPSAALEASGNHADATSELESVIAGAGPERILRAIVHRDDLLLPVVRRLRARATVAAATHDVVTALC